MNAYVNVKDAAMPCVHVLDIKVSGSRGAAAFVPRGKWRDGSCHSPKSGRNRIGIEGREGGIDRNALVHDSSSCSLRNFFLCSSSGFPDLLARPLTAQLNAVQVEPSS